MPLEFTPFLGILAGIAFTLLLSTLAILTIIRLKYRGKVATPSATPTTALPSQADEEEYYPSPRPLRPADSVPLYPPSGAGSEDSSSGYASSGGRAAGGLPVRQGVEDVSPETVADSCPHHDTFPPEEPAVPG